MGWTIELSRQVEKFLAKHRLPDEAALELVRRAIQKFSGEAVAVDLKRLTGKWAGHFRIRTSKYRLIFSINFDEHFVLIEVFDNRDSAYR